MSKDLTFPYCLHSFVWFPDFFSLANEMQRARFSSTYWTEEKWTEKKYVKRSRIEGNRIPQDCTFAFTLSRLSLAAVKIHLALSEVGQSKTPTPL